MTHLFPFYNLAQMTVVSTGTGPITLGSANGGLLTFETAGCSTASGGQEITYAIADSSKSEINRGVYYSSSMLLTRTSTTYIKTSNSDNPIDISNTSLVAITAGTFDLKITPTISVLTSPGSGTYTPPLACIAIEVIGIAGGQGGQAGGGGADPAKAGDTTFALSSATILTANGGGSSLPSLFGSGGTASGGNILNITGGDGRIGELSGGISNSGGAGGKSLFGGAGVGGTGGTSPSTWPGGAGQLGGGGGGGSRGGDFDANRGGGAGGAFWHLEPISSISSALSYAYVVGAGTAGVLSIDSGGNGGNGGNGALIIKEYYLG